MTPRRRRHQRPSSHPRDLQGPALSDSEEVPLTAAERYRAARNRAALAKTERGRFAASLSWELDEFQQQALASVENGDSVLVAAPTGAGKTLVGEFACQLALRRAMRAFYTTPIKALSNQKFLDFRERFGADQVGLMTGDRLINPEAPVVVMTTEVARNMLYEPGSFSSVGYLILDEVHYLADRQRGAVWEELIIMAPLTVSLIALSATVSNAEDFGNWVAEVRGGCDVIVSEQRPVPLTQKLLVGSQLLDLYRPGSDGKLNPQLRSLARTDTGWVRAGADPRVSRRTRAVTGIQLRARSPRLRRTAIRVLAGANLLPAIYFVFSRNGCDEAVRQLIDSGICLTTEVEQAQIQQFLDERTAFLTPGERAALNYEFWRAAVSNGYAAHHAGMLPALKEAVELLFSRSLLKLVFATETLALGINMPARTVVLESLVKWDGSSLVRLTAGQYTQLTGRAGRRGIDVRGHAIVALTGDVEPEEIAALASKRTYPLNSAFTPTYNFVANLAYTASLERAREIVELSFAQYQTDRAVVGLAQEVRRCRQQVDQAEPKWDCPCGDISQYLLAREELTRLEKQIPSLRTTIDPAAVALALQRLEVGSVINFKVGSQAMDAVVVSRSEDLSAWRGLAVVTAGADYLFVTEDDLPGGFSNVGKMRVTRAQLKRPRELRRELAREVRFRRSSRQLSKPKPMRVPLPAEFRARISHLRDEITSHPVHGCTRREEHVLVSRQWLQAQRRRRQLEDRLTERSTSLARRFDGITKVLQTLKCLQGGVLTASGKVLREIHCEQDLTVTLCLVRGLWDELTAPTLTAVVCACLFNEPKNHQPAAVPDVGAAQVLGRILARTAAVVSEINEEERRCGLDLTPSVEPGLSAAVLHWAAGGDLASTVALADLEVGDWVRSMRLTIDLLGQIAALQSAGTPVSDSVIRTAREAITCIQRSVVDLTGDLISQISPGDTDA